MEVESKANLALIKSLQTGIVMDEDRVRFTNLNIDDGVSFEGSDLVNNDKKDYTDIAIQVLGVTTTRVDDRLVLDTSVLSNKLEAIAELFGVVFNADGTIDTEEFHGHTHEYYDKTIADTEDGTGAETDTARETSGVS